MEQPPAPDRAPAPQLDAGDEAPLIERLMAAVWMVGNMDTAHDKAAWWADYRAVWDEVAKEPRVQAWADRESERHWKEREAARAG